MGIYFDNPNNVDITDCVCDDFYSSFRNLSNRNTTIYDECFKCLPSNNIKTMNDLLNYQNQNSLSKTNPKKVN